MTTMSPRALTPEGLARLNSATQYPSIPTYHAMDRGRLTEQVQVPFDEVPEVEVFEKIDGTNTRLIFPPDGDYPLIGSRTELLTFLPDLVHNPSQGIVDAVRATAARLHDTGDMVAYDAWTVVWGEVYGGKVGQHAKQYTGDPTVTGFRVFDIAHVPPDVLDHDREWIAGWRDGRHGPWWTPEQDSRGGQSFLNTGDLAEFAGEMSLPMVPLLADGGRTLPVTLTETWKWLRGMSTTSLATLTDGASGASEGVVVRSADRSRIAKIRHEDYRKVLARK